MLRLIILPGESKLYALDGLLNKKYVAGIQAGIQNIDKDEDFNPSVNLERLT